MTDELFRRFSVRLALKRWPGVEWGEEVAEQLWGECLPPSVGGVNDGDWTQPDPINITRCKNLAVRFVLLVQARRFGSPRLLGDTGSDPTGY